MNSAGQNFKFKELEEKWQRRWEESKIFDAEIEGKEKFFLTVPYLDLSGYKAITSSFQWLFMLPERQS
jgi:valyl-tRNA synthetase